MKKLFWFSLSMLVLSLSLVLNMSMTKGAADRAASKTDPPCGNDVFYGMTLDDFMQGVARYRQFHAMPSTVSIGKGANMPSSFNDARSCWYSIDTLKKFICLIEQYSAQAGAPTDNLGIRFYYGMYQSRIPSKLIYEGRGISYPNYSAEHTLFMVPTYRSGDDDLDFDPRSIALDSQRRKRDARPDVKPKSFLRAPLFQLMNSQSLSDKPLILDYFSANAGSIMAKNQGKLCPPTCPATVNSTMKMIDDTYPSISYK